MCRGKKNTHGGNIYPEIPNEKCRKRSDDAQYYYCNHVPYFEPAHTDQYEAFELLLASACSTFFLFALTAKRNDASPSSETSGSLPGYAWRQSSDVSCPTACDAASEASFAS